MSKLIYDPTALIYLATIVLTLYGAGLFAWWWIKKGQASAVFAYVLMIFLGEFVESCVALYARSLAMCDEVAHHLLLMSPAWPSRKSVTVLALAAIVIHMSYRAFCCNRKEQDE